MEVRMMTGNISRLYYNKGKDGKKSFCSLSIFETIRSEKSDSGFDRKYTRCKAFGEVADRLNTFKEGDAIAVEGRTDVQKEPVFWPGTKEQIVDKAGNVVMKEVSYLTISRSWDPKDIAFTKSGGSTDAATTASAATEEADDGYTAEPDMSDTFMNIDSDEELPFM